MRKKKKGARLRRMKGEGSIRWDETNQRYVGSFLPRNGARRYFAGKKGESESAFLARFGAEKQKASTGVRSTTDTFAAFLQKWLTSVESNPDLRPRTYESYKSTVDQYLVPAVGDVLLTALTRDDVRAAMNEAAHLGRSTRTINYIRTIARIALGVAVDEGLVDRNVAMLTKAEKVRKDKTFVVNPYTIEEVATFSSTAVKQFNGLVVVIGAFLGLRRGELCGLQWQDFDAETGRLAVQRQVLRYAKELHVDELKTSKSRRLLTLPPFLVDELKRHRRAQLERRLKAGARWRDEGFIFAARFGGPLDPRNVQRLYDRILREAGVPKRRLHDLRHTVATLHLQLGTQDKVISEILGHSSTRITKDIYAHVTPVMMTEAASKMEAMGASIRTPEQQTEPDEIAHNGQ
jgi:integrase